jgi:hypothetical protein
MAIEYNRGKGAERKTPTDGDSIDHDRDHCNAPPHNNRPNGQFVLERRP